MGRDAMKQGYSSWTRAGLGSLLLPPKSHLHPCEKNARFALWCLRGHRTPRHSPAQSPSRTHWV